MQSVLNDVYYSESSPACYAGINAVLKEANKRLPSIKKKDVVDFLSRQETYTLHKPLRRRFPRNKVVAAGLDTDWQADLCDMQSLKKQNDGHTFILTCVDVLSKFAWAVPIQNKKPETVRDAFAAILKDGRKPWRLFTDKGLEFTGRPFQNFLKKHDIKFITSRNPDVKASNVERWNRTLKTRLWKHFTKTRSYRYIDALPAIVSAINNSYHRVIKHRPADVTSANELEVWATMYKQHIKPTKFKFKVNDHVRISKYKHVFEKGYLPNFTKEIFVVVEQIPRRPPVYKLKDWHNDVIDGLYYETELVKVVKSDEIYTIEKIEKTRTRKGIKEHFVKWDGYPKSFNQWIPASQLVTTA